MISAEWEDDGEGGTLDDPVPMQCNDCGAPLYYDDAGPYEYHHILPADRERGCFLVGAEPPLGGEQLTAVLIARGWAEITADLRDPSAAWPWFDRDGRTPYAMPWPMTAADIACFGDLHSYCDANTYALLCDGAADGLDDDEWIALGNVVQESLDLRLRRGEHLQGLTTA